MHNIFTMFREAQPYIRTSVNVSPEMHRLAKQHKIRFSEAIRTGMGVLLAEKGVVDYDSNLNLYRRMMIFKQKAEDALAKIDYLKEVYEAKNEKTEAKNGT